MPMAKTDAKDVTLRFLRDYPGAMEVAYNFKESTQELYGRLANEVPASMKGGYVPKPTEHNGRTYRGKIDVVLENITDARDLLTTLRHEVLGHYGANTFAPAEKRAFLDGLTAAREEPSLKPLWEVIEKRYRGSSQDVLAEEVFALHCEGVSPSQHVGNDQVQALGKQSFAETCIARARPMQASDLQNIACMVAQGIRDRSRTQQTFPHITELFRKGEAMEPKKPFHEIVAEKLIEQLKAGTAPWQKPWAPGDFGSMPMNPTTGNRYKGINAINLMMQGRSDPRWMTFNQAKKEGAQVRKGEKSTMIQKWNFTAERDKKDKDGKPVLDGNGKPIKETVRLERPFCSTAYATVAAFDSGNLPHVAKQMREQFPDKPILIAGDNDLHQELIDGKNPGRTKAQEAAKAVEGKAIFPIFAPGEQAYPASVERIDQEKARAGNLTPEQQEAINQMKRFTDFNDLATKSSLGREGLDRQVRAEVGLAIEKHQECWC